MTFAFVSCVRAGVSPSPKLRLTGCLAFLSAKQAAADLHHHALTAAAASPALPKRRRMSSALSATSTGSGGCAAARPRAGAAAAATSSARKTKGKHKHKGKATHTGSSSSADKDKHCRRVARTFARRCLVPCADGADARVSMVAVAEAFTREVGRRPGPRVVAALMLECGLDVVISEDSLVWFHGVRVSPSCTTAVPTPQQLEDALLSALT